MRSIEVIMSDEMCLKLNFVHFLGNIPGESKRIVFVKHVTLQPLNEELLLINKEMQNYMFFFSNKYIYDTKTLTNSEGS